MAGRTAANHLPVLGVECKKEIVRADDNGDELGNDVVDEDKLPEYSFVSDNLCCFVFVRVPLDTICEEQFRAGHESFHIDLGELPEEQKDDDEFDAQQEVSQLFCPGGRAAAT